MSKKLSLVLLSVLLILTLVACGQSEDVKDEGESKNPSSSEASSGDPTQDYDDDEFAEAPITNEELEDLWGQISDDDAQINIGGSDDSSSDDSSSKEDNNKFEGTGTIGQVPDAIF